MDDLCKKLGIAGILGAAAHDAHRHIGQGGNQKLIAGQMPLDQAAHCVEALQLLLSIDG